MHVDSGQLRRLVDADITTGGKRGRVSMHRFYNSFLYPMATPPASFKQAAYLGSQSGFHQRFPLACG